MASTTTLHTIDIAPLFERGAMAARREVAKAIEAACRATGFFYITGHGIPDDAFTELDRASRSFFALSESEKAEMEAEFKREFDRLKVQI